MKIEEREDNANQEEEEPTKEDLAFALPGGLARLATGGNWFYGGPHYLIEDALLEAAYTPNSKIIISTPPRTGKSMLCSQFFPAWYLGRFPDRRVILATYASDFSATWGRKSRDVLSEWGKDIFGVEIDESVASAKEWGLKKREGGMRTAGVGGPITGFGADVFIMDDLIKNSEEALSPANLESQVDWFMSVADTRLSPRGSLVLIATRWPNDLTGWLKENQPGEWKEIRIPAQCDDPENDPLGREKNEWWWPEQWPPHLMEKRKQNYFTSGKEFWWHALFQQRPVSLEGDMIKVSWFRRYTELPERESVDMTVLSFDTASKDNELSDFTVCGVWLIKDNKFYLADVIRGKFDHPTLLRTVNSLLNSWMPNIVLVEDKGSGISLIQHLQEEDRPVLPVKPENSKLVRMQVETPAMKAGQVYLPDRNHIDSPWLDDYEEELRAFPKGANDDQVDMTSQFLKYARENLLNPLDIW